MLFRRRQDVVPVDNTTPDGMLQSVKRVAIMLISAIRFFAEDYKGLNSSSFKKRLNQESHQLETAATVEALEELYERLKSLIFQQGEMEKEYRQKQFGEFSKIFLTLIEGLSALTDDNSLFNTRLDSRLGQIGRVVELDDLQQIRTEMTQEIDKVKRLMQAKKQHDQQSQQALVQQVEILNSQLETAHQEVRIDGLTKIYNRRAFDLYIEDEVHRSQLIGHPLVVMLFDVDHFKQVNDNHGHLVGDRLLFSIAQRAKKLLRTDDFIARYGGEEFVIVVSGDSAADAPKILERLRETIAQREFRYRKNDGTDQTLRVTVSGGIAWFRESDTVEALIERADRALYLAKQRGRNRIHTEKELEPSA